MAEERTLTVAPYISAAALANVRVRRDAPQRRQSSNTRPGALETLDEVSHINALHLQAQEDDEAAIARLPPTQRALAAARADGYSLIATDLTTPRWKERWERMCLEAPDPSQSLADPDASSGGIASVNPGMVRSSSRPSLANPTTAAALAAATVREAEQWRSGPSFNRTEVTLSTAEAAPGVLALLSQWLELDAVDEGVRLDAELAMIQEVSYAAHANLSTVVLPPPSSDPERRRFLPHYARAIAECLATPTVAGSTPPAGNWMTLVVRLPICSPYEFSRLQARRAQPQPQEWGRGSPRTPSGRQSSTANHKVEDDWAWDTWATIQDICNHNPRVKVMLDLGLPLPQQQSVLNRWNAEPVAALWIPAGSFLLNKKGFPVLSKSLQRFVCSLMHKHPHVILADTENPAPGHAKGGSGAYLQYIIKHLERERRTINPDALDPLDTFAQGYADKLQAPLQPLLDNLESTTYAVFEKDTTKYDLYEEAITAALADLSAAGRARGGVHIWVCGAGRGPLVSRCLAAASRARTSVHITALEKNPNALVVLQERQQREWGVEMVTIRYGDMRALPSPPEEEKADIVVSELLGSFGDNELSPECLDGAMRFLRADGISIPSTYYSFLTPLTSPTLYTEATGMKAVPPISDKQKRKAMETPYVVLLRGAVYPAARGGRGGWAAVQPVWAFQHGPIDMTSPVCDAAGLPLTNAHNVRTSALTFHIPQAAVVHGLAGYFEARLYGDITLSTHPDPGRGSPEMNSWFPLFLPFATPLYLPAGSELDVHMWRMTASRRVWYEWYAESFLPLPVQFGGAAMAALNNSPEHHATGYASPPLAEGAQPAAGGEPNPGAFQNAPYTPSLLAAPHLDDGVSAVGMTPQSSQGGNHRLSAGSTASAVSHTSPPAHPAGLLGPITRVKTNMTALMNPGGRSSWISL